MAYSCSDRVSIPGLPMKKPLFAGIAAATLCAATVFAADMPVKAPVYKTAPPIFSWTGCYLGIEGGGGWGQTEQNIAEGPFGDGSTLMLKERLDGGLIGGTAGCNYQAANWVLGLEGDLSWTNLKGDGLEVPNSQIKLGTKVGILDTFRGRIGYAYDRTLFYVTGGLAYANIEATETSLGQGINASVNGPNTGWTVGTGIEWALPDPHWSVKAEYLYVSFDNKLYIFEPGDINRFVKLNENIVRSQLSLRLGQSSRCGEVLIREARMKFKPRHRPGLFLE
jgi:outer membrane immunogenic protein